jgi:hypothetical protein
MPGPTSIPGSGGRRGGKARACPRAGALAPIVTRLTTGTCVAVGLCVDRGPLRAPASTPGIRRLASATRSGRSEPFRGNRFRRSERPAASSRTIQAEAALEEQGLLCASGHLGPRHPGLACWPGARVVQETSAAARVPAALPGRGPPQSHRADAAGADCACKSNGPSAEAMPAPAAHSEANEGARS